MPTVTTVVPVGHHFVGRVSWAMADDEANRPRLSAIAKPFRMGLSDGWNVLGQSTAARMADATGIAGRTRAEIRVSR